MGNKVKEEEKIERTLRALLKLPENKRCINCNSLGPQYVCTTFLTFVCTNCSGIHREFTHRVKSVSMAKFSAEEVTALQAAGNERARQIYFKEWDPQHHSLPDSSNLHRLRDFIKHVYVDRKYSGERSDKLPMVRLRSREHSYENMKASAFSGGSNSPHSEDIYEQGRHSPARRSDERTFKGYYDERRSPRYAQENSRYGGIRRNPVRFEVVDDRFRDDGHGSGRRHDSRSFSNKKSIFGSRSPSLQKTMNGSTSPVVRSAKDILGEDTLNLVVDGRSKATAVKDADGSANHQNIVSAGAQNSVDGNPMENNKGNIESLIDFSMDSKPRNAMAESSTQTMPTSSDGGNLSSCELSSKEKEHQANTLESILFGLSAPSVCSIPVTAANASSIASVGSLPVGGVSPTTPSEQMLILNNNVGSSKTASVSNALVKPPNVGPQAVTDISGDCSTKAPEGPQLLDMYQHQPSTSPASDSSSKAEQSNPPVSALSNEPYTSSIMHNTQAASNGSAKQSTQATSSPAKETSSGIGAQPSVETKSNGRQELPADLFTACYPSAPAAVPRWQSGPPQAMAFDLHYYPNAMNALASPNTAKSSNPFDFNCETIPAPASAFLSMASLRGAIPNVSAPAGMLRTSSTGAHSSGLMAHQSPSYLSMMRQQSPTFASTMSSSAYMGSQVHLGVPPSGIQGIGGFGKTDGAVSGSLATTRRPAVGYSASSPPNSFSTTGGNPFG